MRVRGDSPGRSSGGSVGDRDEPRAIAGLIYSACDEKRSVPNAWREIPVGRQSRDFRTDEARARYLGREGIRVLRFSNLESLQETEGVLEAIWQALGEPSP